MWDLRSQQGKPIQVLSEAKDSVTCIVIQDREIVASSVDGHVRTYDLRVGQLTADFFDREWPRAVRYMHRLTPSRRTCHLSIPDERCADYAGYDTEQLNSPDGPAGRI